MPDALFFVFGILGSLIPIVIIGLIIYGIIVWRRRASASESAPDTNADPGIGTVRRLYFYIVAFVALMMTVSGIVFLLQFILDSIFVGDVISDSNVRLAAGGALLIVGAPLWYFHWRYVQRAVAEQPVETRSILRKIYIYITHAVAGSILIYTAVDLLNWIFQTEDFSGYNPAALVIWGTVYAFHWRLEQHEGQSTLETRAISRLYIYIASLVGLAMLSFGAGRVIYFVLLEGYNALVSTPVLSGDAGLWRHAMREMLSIGIVGALVWWLQWLHVARRDFNSVLRQVYLYIFAILGGVMVTLVALGIIIHEILAWILGTTSADTTAQHFEFLPGSVATLAVGAALWAYHWYKVRLEAGMSAGTPLSARRAYTYILTAIGTGALAVAVFMLVGAALKLILASFGDVVVGGDQWKHPLANIITLAVLGAPLWGYYWQNIQRRTLDLGTDERQAISRRIFLFAALGIGVIALLGSVSALLFMFLRDLLEVSLSLDTLNDMAEPLAIIAASAAFLPYYWSVYRQDQEAASDIVPEDSSVSSEHFGKLSAGSVEGQPARKPVTLLAGDDSATLAGQIQDALGYDIDTLRWADIDAAMPALTDEACVEIAQSIADAPGSYVLLIPDGGAVRVLSHD